MENAGFVSFLQHTRNQEREKKKKIPSPLTFLVQRFWVCVFVLVFFFSCLFVLFCFSSQFFRNIFKIVHFIKFIKYFHI